MPSKIKELHERKRQLVAESDINRQILRIDYEHASASALWLDKGYQTYRTFQPALRFILPAASFALLRKPRPRRTRWAKGLIAWKLGRRGWKTWRALRMLAK
jgi:hypothetical protein